MKQLFYLQAPNPKNAGYWGRDLYVQIGDKKPKVIRRYSQLGRLYRFILTHPQYFKNAKKLVIAVDRGGFGAIKLGEITYHEIASLVNAKEKPKQIDLFRDLRARFNIGDQWIGDIPEEWYRNKHFLQAYNVLPKEV